MKTQNRLTHVCIALGIAAPGFANSADLVEPAETGSWAVQYGIDSSLHRLTLNYETPVLWSYRFDSSRIDLVGEFGVSYWHDRDHGEHGKHAWQVSAIPMFQWWLTRNFYVEGGIGLTGFNTTRFGDNTLSTAFQFGDHIGVGYRITDNMRVNLRVSHFSNARIKRPNRGLNSYQLGLTMRF